MSERESESQGKGTDTSSDDARSSESKKRKPVEHLYLVPYPKIIFLYPTAIVALVCAIVLTLGGKPTSAVPTPVAIALAWCFLGVFMVNLFVLAIDFPRASGLLLLFIGSTILLGLILVATLKPDFIPYAEEVMKKLDPHADATFYWIITAIFSVVLLVTKISVQFNYWEFRRNELLHHHGFLSDLKQYPVTGAQIEKEITDIFEYFLLRSGRLIIKVPGQDHAFVLENVLFIGTKEKQIVELRKALKVELANPN